MQNHRDPRRPETRRGFCSGTDDRRLRLTLARAQRPHQHAPVKFKSRRYLGRPISLRQLRQYHIPFLRSAAFALPKAGAPYDGRGCLRLGKGYSLQGPQHPRLHWCAWQNNGPTGATVQ
jgi:hypothetical protein